MYPIVDGSAGTRPSWCRASAWIRGEARRLESSDWSAAFSARSLVRCWFARSSCRFRRRTPTLTKTTPARRTPETAIQTMPARACARRLARPRVAGFARRGAANGSASVSTKRLAKLHRHAEPRRRGPRIARDLGRRRANRTPRRRPQHGLGPARAERELRRARAAVLLSAQEALDDPVLERVERDDGEAALRTEDLDRRRQRALERSELVVHLDAERLEHALRRVPVAEPRRRRDRVLDRLDEVARPLERLGAAAPRDRPRDLPRVALLPEAAEDLGQLALVVLVDDLARRQVGRGVHAHVERRVGRVREAAFGSIELHRRDAEIEQDAVRVHAVLRELRQHRRELAVQQPHLRGGAT